MHNIIEFHKNSSMLESPDPLVLLHEGWLCQTKEIYIDKFFLKFYSKVKNMFCLPHMSSGGYHHATVRVHFMYKPFVLVFRSFGFAFVWTFASASTPFLIFFRTLTAWRS